MKQKPVRAPLNELEELLEATLEVMPEEGRSTFGIIPAHIKIEPKGFAGILEELIELKKKFKS